jgi:hypothetical protein
MGVNMINCINFIFNILYFFLAISILIILPIGFLILWEKWQERNEVELDDTSTMFLQPIKHKLKQ